MRSLRLLHRSLFARKGFVADFARSGVPTSPDLQKYLVFKNPPPPPQEHHSTPGIVLP